MYIFNLAQYYRLIVNVKCFFLILPLFGGIGT